MPPTIQPVIFSTVWRHIASRDGIVIRIKFTTCFLIAALFCSVAHGQQPRRDRPQFQIPDDLELVPNVTYGTGGERPLQLSILRPKSPPSTPMPVVVFIHGGGWRGGSKQGGIRNLIPLAKRGYFCASIDYRLSGEAIFPAQIEDCKCAIRFLRAKAEDYHLDADRIGVWGSSAGGHLVALLGTAGDAKDLEGKGGRSQYSSRVQAVCDWFGPTDFLHYHVDGEPNEHADGAVAQLLGGPVSEKKELAAKASPVNYVTKDDPPFLIMHGDRDLLVPLRQSEMLRDALQKVGVEATLKVVKDAGHGLQGPDVDRGALLETVLQFFDRTLKTSK
jgi:acetyl esterase/lipase